MTRSATRRSTVTAPAEVVARDADESLHAGRFKKAAELYKQLLRRESRPEWRERLAEVSRAEQNQATVVPVAESGAATSFISFLRQFAVDRDGSARFDMVRPKDTDVAMAHHFRAPERHQQALLPADMVLYHVWRLTRSGIPLAADL